MFTLIIEDKHGGIADEYSFEEGEFYVGRSHTSDIILPSDNVSRRHARLYTVDGRCYIEDLQSSNGVFVNGRRIHEVFQIQRSAQIKIGDYYLHIESDSEHAPEEDRTWCRLTGRNLAFTGQVFRVMRKVNLIGRGKDCTLTIIDPSVSRIHAKLSVERSGALTVEDLKSSNGTFLNDERIDVATIHHRDVVRFGNVEFLVDVPDEEGTSIGTKASVKPESKPVRDRPRSVVEESLSASRSMLGLDDREPDRERERSGLRPASIDEPWADERPKRSLKWLIWTLVIGFVLVITTIVLVAFKDEIFGGGSPVPDEPAITETGEPPEPPPEPSPEDVAREAAEKRQRMLKDIEDKLEVGKEDIKARRWELAKERFQAVLDLDPLNAEARRAINHIAEMEEHKKHLEEARRLRDSLKRGDAAEFLRRIDDASVYYREAQEELDKLQESKPTLFLTADNLLRQRDCDGALSTLEELEKIDPKDEAVPEKMSEIKKLVGTRKCDR